MLSCTPLYLWDPVACAVVTLACGVGVLVGGAQVVELAVQVRDLALTHSVDNLGGDEHGEHLVGVATSRQLGACGGQQ